MLVCECGHRAHQDAPEGTPPLITDAEHTHPAGIGVLLAFEVREVFPGAVAQVAVCALCSDAGH